MPDRQHIHLIGIGGTGLSAIARVLFEQGYEVSGSDRVLSVMAKELAALGVRIYTGHQAQNIAGASLVVRSSAVPDSNVEVEAAQAAGIPVLKRSEFLPMVMEGKYVVAVAGTHGKTTTTAMIAWLLDQLEMEPSYIIGGMSKNLGGNAHAGAEKGLFVIEADEYDRMFLGLEPDIIVITNAEHDHPDCFPTLHDYLSAYKEFIWNLRPGGHLFISHDDPGAHLLSNFVPPNITVHTFGTNPGANFIAANLVRNERGGFDYDACRHSKQGSGKSLMVRVSLQVPGEHNVRNSLAALAVTQQVGAQLGDAVLDVAAQGLSEFVGTGRRFDVLGEAKGITVIDDYAHHPTEISATLAAARARYGQKRIWAVWQPHTFSRTLELHEQFANAFSNADQVVVTEIYPAREKAEDFQHYSSAQIVQQMNHPAVQFVPNIEDAVQHLLKVLQPGDVLLVLSAGDADQISARVLAVLQERSQSHA